MERGENMNEKAELKQDELAGVSGGCFLWGAFGSHDYDMQDSYPVTHADGTRHYFLKFQCRDCGKIFYFRKLGASGKQEEISESEYINNRGQADVF